MYQKRFCSLTIHHLNLLLIFGNNLGFFLIKADLSLHADAFIFIKNDGIFGKLWQVWFKYHDCEFVIGVLVSHIEIYVFHLFVFAESTGHFIRDLLISLTQDKTFQVLKTLKVWNRFWARPLCKSVNDLQN